MAIPLDTPPKFDPPPAARPKKRSVLGGAVRRVGWFVTAPVTWLGTRQISRSASFIADMASALRAAPRPDPRFRTESDGGFDVAATAFSYGISEAQLRARLRARRRQTARIAYAAFALAVFFFAAWLVRALSSPWTEARIASAVNFLPFCLLFVLVAFYNALLNFQIRVGRSASWGEYLRTTERFWPC